MLGLLEKLFGVDAINKVRAAMAAAPLIGDAIRGGPAAFEAFKAQAPAVTAHLQDFANAIKQHQQGAGAAAATNEEMAAVAAHIAGVDPPGWTHEDTQRWWDRATGDIAGQSGK